nr:hypothetical protein TorRG33x02_269960 [Ipomoea batatas]
MLEGKGVGLKGKGWGHYPEVGRRQLRQLQTTAQILNHPPHARPCPRLGVSTQQPKLQHHLHLRFRIPIPQIRIHCLQNIAINPPGKHPIHQDEILVRHVPRLQRHFPARNFQHQRPERVHLAALRRLAAPRQLRRQVPQRSHHAPPLAVVQSRQAEPSDLAVEFAVQEDVAGVYFSGNIRGLIPFFVSGPVAAEKPTNISPMSKTEETLSYRKVRRGEDWVPAEESQVPKRTVLVAISGDPRRRRHHSVHVDSDVVVAQVVKLPGLDHVELDGEDMVGGVPVGGLIHQSHKLPGGAAGEIVGRRNDESHSMAAFRGE